MASPSYTASIEQAAYYPLEQAGFLRFSGPDRFDFLQRQTTRDVRNLKPGQALGTVLTSPTARILDVLTVVVEAGETPEQASIAVLTLPGQGAKTAQFLKSRIFFKDDVKLVDLSAQKTHFELIGPLAEQVLSRLGLPAPQEFEQAVETEDGMWVMRLNERFSHGYRLVAPADGQNRLEDELTASGAVRMDAEAYEIRRVEAGLPGGIHELNEDFTPLEVSLAGAVSDNKGCYTGQEVIARQLTYDKVTRFLTGLRLQKFVERGAQVLVDEKPAGKVTSSASSPRFGPIALAVLKRPYHEPGMQVILEENAEKTTATTVSLPFCD